MDRIPGSEELYIGGMFALHAKSGLKSAAISHMVSCLRLPLDKTLFEGYEHLVIEVDDMEDENIIEHFPTANKFISKALEDGGAVFIHCAMGKSRSAAVLAAYLMQSRQLDPDEAISLIRTARPFVDPNQGFMEQLWLFHRMKYTATLDEHPIYQRWLYDVEVKTSIAARRAPERIYFRDEVQRITEITQTVDGEIQEKETKVVELRCRKCRNILATSDFLVRHTPKATKPPSPCAHHFVEAMSWMRSELEQQKLEGKLDCQKCHSKVGSYCWAGTRCSCGEWVTPGISLARGRVDEVIKVKL